MAQARWDLVGEAVREVERWDALVIGSGGASRVAVIGFVGPKMKMMSGA
jgi:hypothetical protein